MKERGERRIFYGWYIVASSFLIMFCSIGIVNNCSGLFIKPVCEDMGFSRGTMAVNMTILSACQMVVALFGGKIFVNDIALENGVDYAGV